MINTIRNQGAFLLPVFLIAFLVSNAGASCGVGNFERLNSTQCGASASASCVSSCNAYSYTYSDGRILMYEDCTNEQSILGTSYCECKRVVCSDRCSGIERQCIAQGKEFDSQNCVCLDNTMCDPYRAQCEQADGVFSGSVNSGCCIATCNQCKALGKVIEQKAQLCCNRGLAPPDTARQCRVNARTTCGMSWSTIVSNDNEFSCRDPSLSESASAAYASCFEPTSSSDAAGSSSGGGGSSGSGADCPECPYLEAILDTLTMQKGIVDEISFCVKNWDLCNEQEPEQDTSLMPLIRPYLDSFLVIGDKEKTIIGRIDTSLFKVDSGVRKIIDIGEKGRQNDTLTREAIISGTEKIQDSLGKVRSSIVGVIGEVSDMNDTTKKYLKEIADSIGVSVDSLVSHLDSIKNTIPKDVMDSIVKYQKLNYEKEIVIDNLPAIDSLIDSMVQYYKNAREYDSIRHVQMSDSVRALHEAIEDISYRIGAIMGYGDTASIDLRGDINGVKDGLAEFRDSALKYWRGILEGGDYQGSVVQGMEGIQTTLNALGDSVGSINGLLNQGSYDTSSVYDGYLSGSDTSAKKFLTDLGSMASGALADSTYDGIFGLQGSDTSSIVGGLPNQDSVAEVLQSSIDSSYADLATKLESYFDTLKTELVLINFDSLVIAPLGAKVPNTNTCPEDCFKIDMSNAGNIFSGVKGLSWGLCSPISSLHNLNVLQFVRLLLRIITAVTCIYIGVWFVSGKRN